MFINTVGDELKLMRCIGQSVMTCIVSGGRLYPVPHSRTVDWCYAVLPPVQADGMADGYYHVDDTKKLREMLEHAGSYADIEVSSGGSSGDYFLVRDCQGVVRAGPPIKDARIYEREKYAPFLPAGLGEAVFGGDDLGKLRKLALCCSKHNDGGGKLMGIWLEEDGAAVATDGKIMAWTMLREKPERRLWFPGSLVLAPPEGGKLALYGGNAWKWAFDGLRYYMYRDRTFDTGYINWRRPVPENPEFIRMDNKYLSLCRDKLKIKTVNFAPPEMHLAEDGYMLRLNPKYVKVVQKLMGRGSVEIYTDRSKFVRDGCLDRLCGPVWFRTEGMDVLVMPLI